MVRKAGEGPVINTGKVLKPELAGGEPATPAPQTAIETKWVAQGKGRGESRRPTGPAPATTTKPTETRTIAWAGETLQAGPQGGVGAQGKLVSALQHAMGPGYYELAGVAKPGRNEVDSLYGFRTEAAVSKVQADLARAGVVGGQTIGKADSGFAFAVSRYGAFTAEQKAAIPADVRQRLDGFLERSYGGAPPSAATGTTPAQGPLTAPKAREVALASMPPGHGLTVSEQGRADDQGGFAFDLKNGNDVVGELHVAADGSTKRVDRPLELDTTATLATHTLEALEIPAGWAGTALKSVSDALDGLLPVSASNVLRDLARIDYKGGLSMEGMKAPWPSMFAVWGLERAPAQLGVYTKEPGSDGKETTFVTISREDFASDLRSRPTYGEAMQKLREQFPDLSKAKPGDSVSTNFTYTGEGTATGGYNMVESFLGSYKMTATFQGIDPQTGKARLDFKVENRSHWQSGTRIPGSWQKMGWPPYLVKNYERGGGVGGNFSQRYIWSDFVDPKARPTRPN